MRSSCCRSAISRSSRSPCLSASALCFLRNAFASSRLAPPTARSMAAGSTPPPVAPPDCRLSVSSAMTHPRECGTVCCRKIERSGDGELLRRFVLAPRVKQRLAPFQVQPPPVGRVFVRLLEFRQREVGAVLQYQRFAPQLERIREMRTLAIGVPEFCDG